MHDRLVCEMRVACSGVVDSVRSDRRNGIGVERCTAGMLMPDVAIHADVSCA